MPNVTAFRFNNNINPARSCRTGLMEEMLMSEQHYPSTTGETLSARVTRCRRRS
jgi:hypothetical protein